MPLPPRPNLEQLRTQARELLRAYLRAEPSALALVEQHRPETNRPFALADAQLVLARSYGFASWPRLKQHVDALVAADLDRRAERERKAARRQALQQQIEQSADRLADAARRGDAAGLFAALAIGARIGDQVRARLVERGEYTAMIDVLLAAIESPDPRTRFLAAQAMDHYADARCAEPLARCLRDPVPRVRWAAIHSIGCEACKLAPLPVQSDLVAALIELALADPSVRVRRVATYELGEVCPDPRAVAALEQIAREAQDATILRNARRALRQL